MSKRCCLLVCSIFVVAFCNSAAFAAPEETPPADSRLGFQLPSSEGGVVEVGKNQAEKLTVICFLGTECPLARLYGPRLVRLVGQFESRGVRFIGVNSNRQDSLDDIRDYRREHAIAFPIAKDYENKIADLYKVKRTPEVVVIDESLTIRYRGRVDDQYLPGVARTRATREDLKIALQELLAGKTVSVATTKPTGCLIGRVRASTVKSDITFCNQASRVLNKHCVECHRPGEIGPFSLTDYDEIVGWGDMMLETIDDGRMPPWHANPQHGKFTNARTMPESDKQVLRDWVAAGMPYGNLKQLPERPKFVDGWQLPRQPDRVIPMRERPFTIPADGTVEYQYFVVDPGFKEDTWVTAAEVVPGNRAVVHHCIVFIRPPDGSRFRGTGWLSGYVPGQRAPKQYPGLARLVPAGSKFVFQMHYTPNGVEQQDLTKVGLVIAKDEDVTHEVFTLVGIDQEFEIPPHKADLLVNVNLTRFPAKAELLTIVPHMHVRGKSFQVSMRGQDGSEMLLDVPGYDFNWQHIYELETPISLSSIDALEMTFRFDNSKNNPSNPDPSKYVTWGDQTWNEMAIAFFDVSQPLGAKAEPKEVEDKKARQDRERKVEKYVDRFFKQFDTNKDGEIEREEMPLSMRRFGFRQFDANDDRRLTKPEIENIARQRFKS